MTRTLPARTRIKICGLRDAQTIDAAVEAGADALGFVFVGSSPRFIKPKKAWPLVASLPPMVTSVGLFQNHSLDDFMEIEEVCPTAMSQLHGDEPVSLVRDCAGGLIKSVQFNPDDIAQKLRLWDEIDDVEAILIDGSTGGLGSAFAWDQLAPLLENITTPIILAGGLNPENVADAIRIVRPYAVDVSSGVESERGVKDHGKVRAFCRAVRQGDASLAS